MGEFLILILILALLTAAMFSPDLVNRLKFSEIIGRFRFADFLSCFKFTVLCKTESDRNAGRPGWPDPNVLNCRVKLRKQEKGNCIFDALAVQICGSIHAPSKMHYTSVRISITDVTDGVLKAKPVQARAKQWQMPDSPAFCYNCDLGKLPNRLTALSDWTAVAELQIDWMIFPRKGKRKLKLSTSIISCESGQELTCATCTFTFENTTLGYIDLQENIQRTKTLAVALAFAVSAADNKLFNCEIEVIKNWARGNIDVFQASNKAERELDKALNQAVRYFRGGNQFDNYRVCKEIVEIAPIAERYDILHLCLHVVKAKGVVAAEELALLKKLARWIEVDTNRFRAMMEKILPVSMHKVRDVEVVLGVTQDMSKEETRRHLNKEYRKWNARVTNFDPEIQAQADHMLSLITEARNEYVGQN